MSLDINKLIKAVKKAAIEAVEAQKPMSRYQGEVTCVNPLEISIDQKLVLTDTQLILTNLVKNFEFEISKGDVKEKYTFHLGLKKGEKVNLLRCDGGQKFIVLDRAEVQD